MSSFKEKKFSVHDDVDANWSFKFFVDREKEIRANGSALSIWRSKMDFI